MEKRLWIVYDEVPEAEWALAFGLDRARADGSRLTVVVPAAPGEELEPEDEALAMELLGVGEGWRRSQRLERRIAAAGLRRRGEVRTLTGGGAERLLAALRAERPDLVAIGRRRRSPLAKLLGGDLVGTLVRRSPCPVALVPAPHRGPAGGAAPPAADPMVSGAGRRPRPMPTQPRAKPRPTMLRQLFAATAPVAVAATAILIVTPVSVSANPVLVEALAVGAGVAVMLAVHLVLMRRTLAPLRELSEAIGAIEPARPGQRIPLGTGATREVSALTAAFNGLLDRVEEQERRSARDALAAQEDERLRIAREIHDEVGQTLTAVTIQAERAAETEGAVDRELLDRIAATALRGLEDVRRIGRELRPEALDDLGLGNALITLCRRLSAQGEVRVAARLEPGGPPLAPEIELVVYRIAQEAITNALRHSGADLVEVSLERRADTLALRVLDDGRGLPAELPPESTGIAGMRERARLVGAELEFSAGEGGGTSVELAVPLAEAPG